MGTITIIRSLQRRPDSSLVLGPVKTTKGERSLALPPYLVSSLRRHRSKVAEERLVAGALWQDLGLVFPSEVGTPVDPSNFRRAFKRAVVRAGLGSTWTPYELRHSALSLLSDAGVRIEDVSDLAGHTDTRTTMNTYRHPVRPVISHAVEPMQRLLGSES